MKKVKYNFLDHTADFGIEVKGTDQKDLFNNTALAMFDLITNSSTLVGKSEYNLHVLGLDMCDLMVNWLRELLYFWNGKQMLIKEVDLLSISEKELSAIVTYDVFDPDIHKIENEIKAVTYHQIEVSKTADGWEARVIFDV